MKVLIFQKPTYCIKYFFLSVYLLNLYKRKLISKCKCSYKNSQHLFKFRNLFCLIHKLYIALVKKTKTKNSENMTISKVQVPQTFKDHISESCLYHSEEPQRDKIYEWGNDISQTKFM